MSILSSSKSGVQSRGTDGRGGIPGRRKSLEPMAAFSIGNLSASESMGGVFSA